MMKRLLGCIPLVLLLGCPLYDDDCTDGQGCADGFRCDTVSSRCTPILTQPSCTAPDECSVAETCTPDFVCRPGSCDYYGCVAGFSCGVVDGAHACVPAGSASDPSALDAGTAEPDAAATADAGTEPPDASIPDAAIPDAGGAAP